MLVAWLKKIVFLSIELSKMETVSEELILSVLDNWGLISTGAGILVLCHVLLGCRAHKTFCLIAILSFSPRWKWLECAPSGAKFSLPGALSLFPIPSSYRGGCLNFSTWFMQNVCITWTDKNKYEVYDIFWKNKTTIMWHVLRL